MRLDVGEHEIKTLITLVVNQEFDNSEEFKLYQDINPRCFVNSRKQAVPYYKILPLENEIKFCADYYVGLDWIIPGKRFVYVAPKINTKLIRQFEEVADSADIDGMKDLISANEDGDFKELNYLKIFLDAAEHPEILNHIDGLLFIDWNAEKIEIDQQDDILTPLLIVQFLNMLKKIVRKGLKKHYYSKEENLQSRVRGKILVSHDIKTNVFRHRQTKVLCQFQEYGIDSNENRFLKKVLYFVSNYIAFNPTIFRGAESTIREIINYCTPAFINVSDDIDDAELKHIKINAFFREYKETITIGQHILKRFAYNISETATKRIKTPPFWFDMPRLFELYVYHQLLTLFKPREIHYHYSTYGNELDFLIVKEDYEMIIDAKYKMRYSYGHIHDDIRQISGYARLSKVYSELGVEKNELIDCLIIYPDIESGLEYNNFCIEDKREIVAYNNVYKLGLKLLTI